MTNIMSKLFVLDEKHKLYGSCEFEDSSNYREHYVCNYVLFLVTCVVRKVLLKSLNN